MARYILMVVLMLTLASWLQPTLIKAGECKILDKTKPLHYITYDGRIQNKVRLKLQNNAACDIVVEIDDSPLGRIITLPNGAKQTEEVRSPVDGLSLPLHYLVKSQKSNIAERAAYAWGDSVATYQIPAGYSVHFFVPMKFFTQGFAIVVPFNYAWEEQPHIARGIGGVQHSIGFLIEQLPPGLIRDAEKE